MESSATGRAAFRVVALSFQAAYRCRHSGACCTAGWPIPVDATRARLIRQSIATGRLRPPAPLDTPPLLGQPSDDGGVVLEKSGAGGCAFHDPVARRCTIHSGLGLAALPVSCAHFPRRLLIEADRIAVSLSHFCPTVAEMLLDDVDAEIVDAPALLDGIEPEGLDARGAWPPLLRPGLLADQEAYRRWELAVVRLLAAARGGPEAALDHVRRLTDRVVRWEPGMGALDEWVAGCVGASGGSVDPRPPADWGGFEVPVGRYLAAKAFGSWAAYQGEGFHAVLESVQRSLDVLREEAASARVNAPLDRSLFIEAVRNADLRTMHEV